MRKDIIIICTVWCIFSMALSGWADEAKQDETEERNAILEEITVIGVPAVNPITPVDTRYGTKYNIVTEQQIQEQNDRDFLSTLRNVPGVMFQSKNLMGSQTSHSLYIRGRGADHPSADFAVEFDGAPRYGALFGQVLGDGIAVPTIGAIEVYKSPQPSAFGSGYALVNILPKYFKGEGQEIAVDVGGGSYGTFNESLSGGLKQGAFDGYVSQSWASTDGHVDHSRAQQQSDYTNLGYRINENWNIRFLANYVDSQTLAPMPAVTPTSANGVSWPGAERYDTQTTFTTLTLNHQYEKFGGYLKAYRNDTDFDLLQEVTEGRRYAGGTGGLWSCQEISLYGIRAKEKLHLWPGGEVLVGADLDVSELKNTQRTFSGTGIPGINGGQAERVWNFPRTTLISPYLAVSQMAGGLEGFHIIPSAGFRYFSHDTFDDKSAFQGGLVAGYGDTDLNVNYARGVNYPSPIALMNMVLVGSAAGDANRYWDRIKPEVVDHYEVGLNHRWPENAAVGVTVFKDKGKDRYRAYMGGAIPTLFNDPIGEYEISGLELTASVTPLASIEFTAGATWMDVKAKGGDGIERDRMPYTPDFQLQAGVNWKFWERFRLFLDLQHLTGLYGGTNMRGSFNYAQLTDANKIGDMTLINTRLGYRFDCKALRLKDSEVSLAVNNILDQDYEYAKGYTMPGVTFFVGVNLRFL